MSAIVVIGISSDLPPYDYSEKIDFLLKDIPEYEIIAINDKEKKIEGFAKSRSKNITTSNSNTRMGLKQAVAKASYVILFWSGYDLGELIFFASLRKIPIKIVPFPLTTVVNRDKGQPFDVYIGRGTPWGNPFPIDHGVEVGRDDVIEKYREYFHREITSNPEKRKQLQGLRGLRLGCHCKPLACHGDIIADYLNSLDDSGEPLLHTQTTDPK